MNPDQRQTENKLSHLSVSVYLPPSVERNSQYALRLVDRRVILTLFGPNKRSS